MDPRKILGVDRNATREEIQHAYRQQVTKYHPDRGGDAWVFQQINDAYERLIQEMDGTSPVAITKKPASAPTSAESQTHQRNQQARREPNDTNHRSRQHRSEPQAAPRSTGGKQPTAQPNQPADPRRRSATAKPGKHDWRKLLGSELPLQNETTTFLLVNVLDIFLTYILLRFGAMEANPLARFFLVWWGFRGMIAFKLVIVTFVCLIAQFIATSRPQTARWLLITGTAIVSMVVAYSVWLFLNKIL